MKTATFEILGKDFKYGLKTVKSMGGTYDPARKTWTVEIKDKFDEGVLANAAEYSLRVVSQRSGNPATTWMGQASMDAEDSIF